MEQYKSECVHSYSDCYTDVDYLDDVKRTVCNFCKYVVEEEPISPTKYEPYRWWLDPFPYH
jgi:hypothetical protein